MASIAPDSSCGHQASILRRALSSAPARIMQMVTDGAAASRASRRPRACTPMASSTRAVAASIDGASAGWVQPLSSSTLRACTRRGQAPAAAAAQVCCAAPAGMRKAQRAAQAQCGAEQPRRVSTFAQQPVQQAFIIQAAGTSDSTTARPISSRWPYSTPDGQVVSQARQVRQRSRCSWVLRVAGVPSSTCLIW